MWSYGGVRLSRRWRQGVEQLRILLIGLALLASVAADVRAQEGSCLSALESRIAASEAVIKTLPHLDANCVELRKTVDAFVAAEAALKKSDRAVKRACPPGEQVRGDSDQVRFQFILEAAKKRLANCPAPTKKN